MTLSNDKKKILWLFTFFYNDPYLIDMFAQWTLSCVLLTVVQFSPIANRLEKQRG